MQPRITYLKSRALSVLPVLFLLSIPGLAAEDDDARALLTQVRLAQNALRNYQCSVEYTNYRDYAARKRELDEVLKTPDAQPRWVQSCKESLESSGKEYELQTIAGDGTGRIKIAHTYGKYGVDDTKSGTLRMDCAWDGAMNVDYSRGPNPGSSGAAVITPTRSEHFLFVRHPMNSFGGLFFTSLNKALETGEKIDVQQGPDGLQHVQFTCENPLVSGGSKWTCAGTIDPAKGFSTPYWEFVHANGRKSRFTATFTEVGDGVWFPTEGRIEGFFPDGMPQVQTSVKIANVIVNDPNFDSTLFHVDLAKGTYVTNRIAGIAYIVGDPTSTRVLGDYTNMGHVVNDAMKSDGPPPDRPILLPHIQQALEKGNSFVLDLKTTTLVGVDKAANSEETVASLRNAGIGDLFWDGGLVVIGETKVESVSAGEQSPLAFTKMDGGGRYKLPEDVQLPYPLHITDRRGSQYDVVVMRIHEEGVSITCRPVPNH